MKNIKTAKVRASLIAKGLISAADCARAKDTICIEGEWNAWSRLSVEDVRVGVSAEDIFFKGIPVRIPLPPVPLGLSYAESETKFLEDVATMYPDFHVMIKID